MKQKNLTAFVLCVVFGIFLASTFAYLVAGTSLNYPLIYNTLPKEVLTNLSEEFQALNNNSLYSRLDAFGFIDFRLYNVPASAISMGNITDKDAAIEAAKESLVKNAKFSGVNDKSQLVVERAIEVNNGNTLNIDFKNQVYNGMVVEGTSIRVKVNAEGVYGIEGHWYPNLDLLSTEAVINEEQAKSELVGRNIIYEDISGNPVSREITENDLTKNAEKAIFQNKSTEAVNLYLAWKIPIGEGDAILWYAYMDAITGYILNTQQMFATAGGGAPRISGTTSTNTSEGTDNGETESGALSKRNLTYLYYAIPIAIILVIIVLVIAKRKR